MRWPWERAPKERQEDLDETERVTARLRGVMAELHEILNEAEERLEKGLKT